MAKLQSTEIVGTTSVSNPPDGNACIWYDTATAEMKITFCGFTGGTWASRNNLINGRFRLAGAGLQNAALAFGGMSSPAVLRACTEAYNGSNWASRNALATARCFLAGAGLQNAALAFGGVSPAGVSGATEAYNGSNWASRNALLETQIEHVGLGVQNQALSVGTAVQAYNGTNWSYRTALPSSYLSCSAGAGTQNAALVFKSNSTSCSYNGSNWSTKSGLIAGNNNGAGAGTQNAALSFGGYIQAPACITYPTGKTTQRYDGAVWGVQNSLANAYYGNAGAGTSNSALSFSGASEAFTGTQTILTCSLQFK